MNFGWRGYDHEKMQAFVVGVESEFYPQIGQLYERRIERAEGKIEVSPYSS